MNVERSNAYGARVEAVTALVKDWRDAPAAIGQKDCLKAFLMTADHRGLTLNGVDGLDYTNEAEARSALAARGYPSLIAAINAQGFDRIPMSFAWPGDLVAWAAPNYAAPFDVALYIVQYAGASVVFGVDPATRTFQSATPLSEPPLACWRIS